MALTEKAKEFNDFRFQGLNYVYNENETEVIFQPNQDNAKEFPSCNCVIRCSSEQVVKAPFGKAFILDRETVIFLKDWQVCENKYGTFVVFNRQFFKPKHWGKFLEFEYGHEQLTFDYFVDVMMKQLDNHTPLIWTL